MAASINKKLIYLFVFLLSVGCSDTVKEHYKNRSEAEAAGLFRRVWLPTIIPGSARDITASNNVDTNVSEGEFKYDPKVTNEFLAHLKKYSDQPLPVSPWKKQLAELQKKEVDALEYSANNSVWLFLVNSQMGYVRYMMWLPM